MLQHMQRQREKHNNGSATQEICLGKGQLGGGKENKKNYRCEWGGGTEDSVYCFLGSCSRRRVDIWKGGNREVIISAGRGVSGSRTT